MKLNELKNLLEANRDKLFSLQLPDKNKVPVSFHITEVGQVNKTFIDCGGKVHSIQTCQLQAWVGDDFDHRIQAGKMADILNLAQAIIPNDDIDVEVEYEATTISQYPIAEYSLTENSVVLHLTTKHTDCLAKELCLLPTSSCCESAGGCC